MARHSKFLEILNDNRSYLTESKFVKGDEDSELPLIGGEDDEIPEEPQEQPQGDQETPEEEQPIQEPQTNFTDREQDILNVALRIYRGDDQRSIESKNEFSEMFKQGKYEELLSRFIAIADDLND